MVVVALVPLCAYLQSAWRRLPLPPSPPKHWIWGNAESLGLLYRHVVYGTEYKQKYGSIISLKTPSETQIILNTAEVTTELLDKQTAYTSDRAHNVLVHDVMNWGTSISWLPHDERHKKARRIMASALHHAASKSYALQHCYSTVDLIRLIVAKPEDFPQHIGSVVGAFVMRLVYGYKVVDNDPQLNTMREAGICFIEGWAMSFWLDYFPFLKHAPSWVPGTRFQAIGKKGRILRDRMIDDPFDDVFEQVCHERVEQPSYTSRLLQDKGGRKVSEEDANLIKWSAGSMYSAGSTTTVTIVMAFLLEVALHPAIAKKAQAEIDSIVGRDRLPVLADRDQLPFFEAFILEVMRLWPPAPLGLAHFTSKEIEFRVYRIPKGSSICGNIWAILRDPDQYSFPDLFDPTRFLKPLPDPDPRRYIFGFGKRVCPGIHIANNSTFIMCAGLLSAFDIVATPELMERVNELGGPDSTRMYEMASSRGPALDIIPFSVNFQVRDASAAHLFEVAR